MKITSIIIKEFLQGIRDIKSFLIMIILPTALTIFLSVIVNEDFNSKINSSNITVKYDLNKSTESYEVESFITSTLKDLNINVVKYSKEDIFNKNRDIYLYINNSKDLVIKFDYKLKEEAKYLKFILEKSLSSYEIRKIHGDEYIKSNEITLKSISDNDKISNLDYYGVTMVTLSLLFSAVLGGYSTIRERREKTLVKLLLLPISKFEIVIGKILGNSLICLIQIVILLIISTTVINVNWGNNLYIITLILYIESIFAISVGNFLGYYFKDNKSCWITLLTLIMSIGLMGGAFIPLDRLNSTLIEYLSYLSPIAHINSAIFTCIYLNNYYVIIANVILLLSISSLIVVLTLKKVDV